MTGLQVRQAVTWQDLVWRPCAGRLPVIRRMLQVNVSRLSVKARQCHYDNAAGQLKPQTWLAGDLGGYLQGLLSRSEEAVVRRRLATKTTVQDCAA